METARKFALARKFRELPNNDAYNQRKKAKPTDNRSFVLQARRGGPFVVGGFAVGFAFPCHLWPVACSLVF